MPKATAHARCKLFYHFRRYFIRARTKCAKRWYNYVNTKCYVLLYVESRITRKINFLCTTIHEILSIIVTLNIFFALRKYQI